MSQSPGPKQWNAELLVAIIGTVIAAFALIPAFGSWLFPQQPLERLPPSSQTSISVVSSTPAQPTSGIVQPSDTPFIQATPMQPTFVVPATPTSAPQVNGRRWVSNSLLSLLDTPGSGNSIAVVAPGMFLVQVGDDVMVGGEVWRLVEEDIPIPGAIRARGWVSASALYEVR